MTDDERARLTELAAVARIRARDLALGLTLATPPCFLAEVAPRSWVVAVDPHSGYGSMPNSLTLIQNNIAALGLSNITMMLQRSDLAHCPSWRRRTRRSIWSSWMVTIALMPPPNDLQRQLGPLVRPWRRNGRPSTTARRTCQQVVPAVQRWFPS